MPSNIEDFIRETNAEIEKLQKKQVSEAKKILLYTYTRITTPFSNGGLSPVNDGLFLHNNFLTINRPTNKITGEEFDPSMIAVIDDGFENIEKAKIKHGTAIYIQNNLPYADRLEAGHSKRQAPNGVYGVAEAETRNILSKRIEID